jgi:hypothetical protein
MTGSLSKLPPPQGLLFLIENLVFKDQEIQLDGYRFKNCAFVNCTLCTHSGNFRIEECFFQGTWWARFSGNAIRLVKLASVVDLEAWNPELKAVIHPSGGVTIL